MSELEADPLVGPRRNRPRSQIDQRGFERRVIAECTSMKMMRYDVAAQSIYVEFAAAAEDISKPFSTITAQPHP